MELVHREVIADEGIEIALLETGQGRVELLAALSPESTVGRFLASRGPGLHHVAYRVADIVSALAALVDRDIELIDKRPRSGILDSRIAFIHPRATGGVLTEIVQSA